MGRGQVGDEPVAGQLGGPLKCPGLLEEVRGPRNHGEAVLAAQSRLGLSVELEHPLVSPTDDEQGRCPDLAESSTGQVRASTSGDHGGDVRARPGRRV